MANNKPFVITIVGAESSGKTTLAMQLAAELSGLFVPEYAREYLEYLGRNYNERDLEVIAERQLERILAVVNRESSVVSDIRTDFFTPDPLMLRLPLKSAIGNRQSAIIVVDGGMLNLRIWARIKYRITIPVVEEALKDDITDLYLLCRPRREWTPDPLREAPKLLDRAWIYNQYAAELMRMNAVMAIIDCDKKEKI